METIALLSAVGAIFWRLFKQGINAINKKQDELITRNTEQMNEIKVEILRLQILDGIDSRRLSKSEVLYLYDKYKELGGNSFVTQKVSEYTDSVEKEASS